MSGEERLRWVEAYKATGNAGLVCSQFNVSRPTLRKWWRRYQEAGLEGLKDSSRKPASSPNRKVFAREEALIVALRKAENLGVHRLRSELRRRHGIELSAETILKVLRRAGEPMKSGARRDGRGAASAALCERSAPVRAGRALPWARLGRRRGERHRVADRQRALPAGAEAERGQSRGEARRRADAHSGSAAAPWLRGDCHSPAEPRRVRRGPLAWRSAAGLCGAPVDRSRDRQRCLPPLHRA